MSCLIRTYTVCRFSYSVSVKQELSEENEACLMQLDTHGYQKYRPGLIYKLFFVRNGVSAFYEIIHLMCRKSHEIYKTSIHASSGELSETSVL